MQIEPSISIQNLPNTPAIQARILRSLKGLERFSDRITSGRVALSVSRRHRHGETVHVRIDLTVPGEEIVVDHDAGLDPAHANVEIALRDAFKAARRRLQDHVRRFRGDVKLHPTGGGRGAPVGDQARTGGHPARRSRGRVGAFEVEIPIGREVLQGTLTIPHGAESLVVFAHGSGSNRHSKRNRHVADVLHSARVGTLLFDLLTPAEARDRKNAFDVPLLADRLEGAARWARERDEAKDLRLGFFGASTGTAAALVAASADPSVGAVVSRGGRPDLASAALPFVAAPTLLLVGGEDASVLEANRRALELLRSPKDIFVVAGAGHLFEEPGTLDEVARRARDWFLRYLSPRRRPPVREPLVPR